MVSFPVSTQSSAQSLSVASSPVCKSPLGAAPAPGGVAALPVGPLLHPALLAAFPSSLFSRFGETKLISPSRQSSCCPLYWPDLPQGLGAPRGARSPVGTAPGPPRRPPAAGHPANSPGAAAALGPRGEEPHLPQTSPGARPRSARWGGPWGGSARGRKQEAGRGALAASSPPQRPRLGRRGGGYSPGWLERGWLDTQSRW